jgi:hypothetical protein
MAYVKPKIMMMNNEMRRMWTKSMEDTAPTFPCRDREAKELNLSQDSRTPGQASNLGSPEYEE